MSLILFLVGFTLVFLGRIKFNEINEEGPQVRAAGIVLMTPFLGALLLNVMLNLMNRSSQEAAALIGLLEFVGWIAAAAIAYSLVFRRSGLPTLSFKPIQTNQVRMPNVRAFDRRDSFPKLMSVTEAARYLNVNEQFIMEAINEGRLAAAKVNQRYTISRSALDELLHGSDDKRTGTENDEK
jgi:excisionase family DNA binding protein